MNLAEMTLMQLAAHRCELLGGSSYLISDLEAVDAELRSRQRILNMHAIQVSNPDRGGMRQKFGDSELAALRARVTTLEAACRHAEDWIAGSADKSSNRRALLKILREALKGSPPG